MLIGKRKDTRHASESLQGNQFDTDGNEIIPQQQKLYQALLVFTGILPVHKDVINVLARFFLMLSGNAAMSSVAPFPCHDLLNVCCDDALNYTLNDGDVQNLKKYSIELAHLLKAQLHTVWNIFLQMSDEKNQRCSQAQQACTRSGSHP